MLRAVEGLFLFGSVVSEMDIMKRFRFSTSSSFYTYVHYAKFFVLKYADISNILWIIGTLITMICEVFLGFLHMHNKMLTYFIAALESFFLFVAGTIRNHTVAEKIFPNHDYATFYINAKIFSLMLTGTVFILSLMFYFAFSDASLGGDSNDTQSNGKEKDNSNASYVEAREKDKVIFVV